MLNSCKTKEWLSFCRVNWSGLQNCAANEYLTAVWLRVRMNFNSHFDMNFDNQIAA